MNEEPLFDFAVPDDLLREAVQHARDPEVLADVTLMPGTGDGKPPPLLGILHTSGWSPLVMMTVAALIPGTFGNGINLIGRNLQDSFHMSNASLGAVAFVAQVAQLLWAVPLGTMGRPRQPQAGRRPVPDRLRRLRIGHGARPPTCGPSRSSIWWRRSVSG